MNAHPPPCDGCDHPADKVDSSPHPVFKNGLVAWRCRLCHNYWMQRMADGAFSLPQHYTPGDIESEPVFTWPDVDNRPPPRGGFF